MRAAYLIHRFPSAGQFRCRDQTCKKCLVAKSVFFCAYFFHVKQPNITMMLADPVVQEAVQQYQWPPSEPFRSVEDDIDSVPKTTKTTEESHYEDYYQLRREEDRCNYPTTSSGARLLDASLLGDLPATYEIFGLEPHQLPVVGVYVDKRVVPGFKYRVLPLPGDLRKDDDREQALFKGRALALTSIGRGYSRRFTFAADSGCLNDNENYFWSDNRPFGFAFELELVSEGDKFTLFDANHEPQGTVEILKVEGPQVEISTESGKDGIKKKARIHFIGKVELYETGVAKATPLSGVVISLKRRGTSAAEVVKVINVTFKRHRYYLTPGIQTCHRRVTVRGEDIGDIPTKYTMSGLQPYEMPVVGTYVDPRVIPGFHYRVRPNDRTDHLFGGRALKLCSVGMGYAKRLTFQPDSLVSPDNYLWSDNHPDGIGLEPRALHVGMRFSIDSDNQRLGEALIFRADLPQCEESTELVETATMGGKRAVVKRIHANVTCVVKMSAVGGRTSESQEYLMRVYGLAIVRKEPGSNTSRVVRVENIAFDSQLNVLFVNTHTELTFYPL